MSIVATRSPASSASCRPDANAGDRARAGRPRRPEADAGPLPAASTNTALAFKKGVAEAQPQAHPLKDMDDDAIRWLLRTRRVGSEHQIAVVLENRSDAPVTFEELALD